MRLQQSFLFHITKGADAKCNHQYLDVRCACVRCIFRCAKCDRNFASFTSNKSGSDSLIFFNDFFSEL